MYSLEVIIAMNRKPKKQPENHLTRQGSFCKSRGGVVIHSASLRSTGFISDPAEAKRFLAKARRLKGRGLNRLIDSYLD